MRGREGKGPPPSTDLLVCFPTRAHLSLMPKPVSSPARPHHRRRPSLLKSSNTTAMWARRKNHNDDADSEPTSPKVTCAGQIKVRSSKPNSCKNWQSVMEEIERMHNHRRKHKKRPPWAAAIGFKKEAVQFLTCLRNLRFDFHCFGSIPAAEISSDDDDEEELDDDDDDKGSSGGAVFSKWFMILQEENNSQLRKEESVAAVEEAAPPANALMLMRCRSAPAKSWLEEREEEKGAEFCEFAVEIGKEDWIQERICRSRSWKR
ncbi:hypothetical protein SASPL_103104 [Salvia splendens]|uniref:Uncharacterized protein n=1 Tax=Salvia splendens TaxID=180675 RepID=A0A8X9ACS1_SALSN|nr:uncharacterized protein LOC121801467 [Salvia splendens]KAG6438167.1 hypothetical protein SASPL_103104 [Salvia splendens]